MEVIDAVRAAAVRRGRPRPKEDEATAQVQVPRRPKSRPPTPVGMAARLGSVIGAPIVVTEITVNVGGAILGRRLSVRQAPGVAGRLARVIRAPGLASASLAPYGVVAVAGNNDGEGEAGRGPTKVQGRPISPETLIPCHLRSPRPPRVAARQEPILWKVGVIAVHTATFSRVHPTRPPEITTAAVGRVGILGRAGARTPVAVTGENFS